MNTIAESTPSTTFGSRRRKTVHAAQPHSVILSEVAGSVHSSLRITLIMAAALLVMACSRLTEANLQKIHPGMTTAEVKAILGEPTSSKTGNMLNIISGTTYIYHTANSDVEINFVDDKVVATSGEFK